MIGRFFKKKDNVKIVNYKMFAMAVSGPKYKEKGWDDCQDSAYYWPESPVPDGNGTQMIAVADGHGSKDCFRSHLGAKAATIVALTEAKKYCTPSITPNDYAQVALSPTGIGNIKYSIWSEWKRLVKALWDDYLKKNGKLNDSEIRYQSVSDKYKSRYNADDKSIVEQYLYTAYGTTLLTAISIKTQLLLLQIGDGTCVVLQRDGEFKIPVPTDEANFLNRTTSLCEDNAHLKIRHRIIDCNLDSPTYPVAVFLSTDGVDDCFPVYKNEEHLYKLYTNIIENILEKGFETTEKELKDDTLPGLTASGSQDDISLAYFIYNDKDILKETFSNIDENYKSKSDNAA